jgi:hypothetical protein
MKVALDDSDTTQRARTDAQQKSLLDGKINNIQQGQLTNPAQGLVDTNIEQTIKEMRDEEARKNNMVVYNAEESTEESPRDRQRADTVFIHTLFRDQMGMLEFKEDHIVNVTRLGKKQDAKNRPMLVKLDTQATKTSILRNTAKLRDADEKYKQVGLEHDYTPKQQAERNKLIEEAKKQQLADKSGNYTYRVRGPPGQLKVRKIKTNQD